MKAVFLFLTGIVIFTGCNNLNSGVSPLYPEKDETDNNYTIPGDPFYTPDELWISLDHSVTISGAEMSIMFFYLAEDSGGNYKVMLWVAYEGGAMGSEMVELDAKTPADSSCHIKLCNNASVGFEELSIKRNKVKVKLRFFFPPPYPENPV